MCEDVWTKIDGIVPKGPLRGRIAWIVLHHGNPVPKGWLCHNQLNRGSDRVRELDH